jgi:hypothetical protein
MSTAIVDARGWQNAFNLRTGEKTETSGTLAGMVRGVLQRHPYPGDMDPASNRWVSETALDLIDGYGPSFVFLIYAGQYFSGRYALMTKEARVVMISGAFLEVEHFLHRSGFDAIVVGTGDMTPLSGFVDATRLDGFAVCTHWSTRYAGLHEPSPEDMEALAQHPHIERLVSREEVVSLFNGGLQQHVRVPEYLMLAREGYAFKTISVAKKTPVMIPSLNFNVPLHAPGRTLESITEIRRALEEELSGKKVALIVMEGVGLSDFPWPHSPCLNGTGWFYYEPGEAQCLTIASGRHCFLDYPTGYKYFDETQGKSDYPFSGYFKTIPEGTFARTFAGKSIAVGNKSMFMHTVTGADVSVESFARNLYNQGTMAVIHRDDKL